jgi:hypothetical protein
VWARKYFFGAFFLYFWAISGRHFFGEIICLAALDLRPFTLNMRPALKPLPFSPSPTKSAPLDTALPQSRGLLLGQAPGASAKAAFFYRATKQTSTKKSSPMAFCPIWILPKMAFEK